NIPARVPTTAYVVENGETLFVAFDARDPDPAAIRAFLRDRDAAWDDDYVGIILDTYGDERRAFEFYANPLGVQMDLTRDDVNGNEDWSWDAIWDSAGRINETGYAVEMAIPLSQLRFTQQAGMQEWSVDLGRSYPRDQSYWLSINPSDRNINCYLCQLTKMRGLEAAEPSRDLEIVPTLTASQSSTTENPGVEPLKTDDADVEAGLTVRWGITPDMTASLTLNPDFSQVEADAAQLEVNNQFALFFPESRPFFLEGADYFSTPERAVFTRTVADPLAGAKLTGKRGNNTIATFAAHDEITNLILPGSQGSDSTSLDDSNDVFVGRYSYGLDNASSIGALMTMRSADGYHNYVGGLDGRWRINDRNNIRWQYLHSDTEYPLEIVEEFDQPAGAFTGSTARFEYAYDSRDWNADLIYVDRSDGFRADAGFMPRVDAEVIIAGIGRTWYGEENSRWSQFDLRFDWDDFRDSDGNLLEEEFEIEFGISGPLQSYTELSVEKRDVGFNGEVFEEDKFAADVSLQPKGGLSLGVFAQAGDQVDFDNTRLADELRIAPYFTWNANRHLLIRFESDFVQLETKQGAKIFDAVVADLRLTWQFSVRSFLRLTMQYQDISRNPDEYIEVVDRETRDVGRQLLYSYKINPQTVFFLGYSDVLVRDDSLNSLTETERTWFMKIGYAWTP
ncbi:MAG: DUF5916 domain-containing protein, partial [Woeseiaceae bacterium]|nr:DUF5916 domain-containing protein [Woeseiaceae bacterium]